MSHEESRHGGDSPSRPPRRGASRSIVFRAVGNVPDALLRDVAARVSRSVPVPCRVGPAARLEDPPLVAGRDQWDADRLLASVEACSTEDGELVAALATKDIGNAVFTHFFGRARLGGRAMVVSLARLGPSGGAVHADDDPTALRASREVLHELGHVAGLAHCPRAACLMHLARTVDAIDVRGGRFCASCGEALAAVFAA